MNTSVDLRNIKKSDADDILRWLNDERVLEYYEGRDRPFSPEMVRKHFFDGDKRVERYIMTYGGKSVGYMQSYPLSEEECADEYKFKCGEREKPVYGIDLFIGEPDLWSKGIGRCAVDVLCRLLVHEHEAKTIILDHHVDNVRAIKCYISCGFEPIKLLKRHEKHEGEMCDCVLMKYNAAAKQ